MLSGLPFSTLPAGVGPSDRRGDARVLRPGGAFLVYQFSPKVKDFLDAAFRADRSRHGMVERAAGAALLGLEGLTHADEPGLVARAGPKLAAA